MWELQKGHREEERGNCGKKRKRERRGVKEESVIVRIQFKGKKPRPRGGERKKGSGNGGPREHKTLKKDLKNAADVPVI